MSLCFCVVFVARYGCFNSLLHIFLSLYSKCFVVCCSCSVYVFSCLYMFCVWYVFVFFVFGDGLCIVFLSFFVPFVFLICLKKVFVLRAKAVEPPGHIVVFC